MFGFHVHAYALSMASFPHRYTHAKLGITITGEWAEDVQHGFGVPRAQGLSLQIERRPDVSQSL